MENQDKLYQQFREAAGEAETKGFDRMEALWGRVEDKLDAEKQRKAATWWKYTGMAAMLLMFITVGTFLYRNEKGPSVDPNGIHENNVTVIDSQKIKETFEPAKENVVAKEAVVVNESPTIFPKKVIEGDSIYFTSVSKRARIWNHSKTVNESSPTNAGIPMLSSAIGYFEADKAERKDSDTETSKEYLEKAAIANTDGTITFKGTVTDSQGVPVPGVIVKVEGTTIATQTDFDGRYSINAKEGEKLIASYVGMQNGSILAYKANANRPIKLSENTSLEAVTLEGPKKQGRHVSNGAITAIAIDTTVVANRGLLPSVNGTIAEIDEGKVMSREKASTGTAAQGNSFAAAKATSKQQQTTAEDKTNADVIQSLQGQVPGLNSTQPAGTTPLIIRGQSSNLPADPLYVIDGVPVSSDVFKNINSDDIVSITVLKDTSATALYGNRGANGVIIVKTKKGLTKRELRKLKREEKKKTP
ncbi:TonB-dependent receptor plug domain-containing protein [Flavobacterium album]|nr:TonB-dependent receptor plug domain-containing protein [Flavobacterium album]